MKKDDSNISAPTVKSLVHFQSISMGVVGPVSGRLPSAPTTEVKALHNYQLHHVAILVDTDELSPDVPQGSTLIVDPKVAVKPGMRVVVRGINTPGFKPYMLDELHGDSLTVSPFQILTPASLGEEPDSLRAADRSTIALRDISMTLKLVGLQYPE